jgi:hypothetical protein
MLRVAAGDSSYQAKINQTGVEALRIPSFETIKTDEYGRTFINPNYQFPSYEIGEDPLPVLSGKIVILGVTAAGISNPVATPSGAQHPHQLQASILETLINGDSVSVPNWSAIADLAVFLGLALALIILSRFKFSIIYIAVILGGYFYLPVYLFASNGILFDVTFNIFAIALIYIHIFTAKYISEYLHHFEPDPWENHHGAGIREDGIGMDRTVKTGSGYAGWYAREFAERVEDAATCPERVLLYFHHLPWTHRLADDPTRDDDGRGLPPLSADQEHR